MKKILYIASCNLYKRTGGGLANLAYYNALISLFPNQIDIALAQEFCKNGEKHTIKIPKRSLLSKCLYLLKGQLDRNKHFFSSFLSKNSNKYELCIINGGLYAGGLVSLFHKYGIKVIVIHHNFEREYHLDNKSILTLFGLSPYLIIRKEKKAYLQSDLNCFLTIKDIELFENYYGLRTGKNELLGVFEPCNKSSQNLQYENHFLNKKNKIVITGSLNSYQTIDGISDFITNYFPITKDLLKNFCIIVAGRNPNKFLFDIQNMNSDCFKVIPNPLNMDEVVKNADIFCCPTKIGGGLKLRVMDGLKLGLPIIVHEKSARGYEMFLGKPYFKIYNNRESFKEGLSSLLNYINSHHKFKEEIITIYDKYFSFNSGCTRLFNIISKFKKN